MVALYHYNEAERLEGPAVVGESVLLQVRPHVWAHVCAHIWEAAMRCMSVEGSVVSRAVCSLDAPSVCSDAPHSVFASPCSNGCI